MAISRTAKLAMAGTCGFLIVAIGITCAVLGAKGYFAFEDPCIGVQSFELVEVDLQTAEGGSSNAIMGFLDTVSGGLLGDLIPTEAVVTMKIVVEVNNTNVYDMHYHQDGEGIIAVPPQPDEIVAAVTNNTSGMVEQQDSMVQSRNVVSPELTRSEDDIVIGTWDLPGDTLKKRARNEIPITLTASIDLLGAETADLASIFINGGNFLFRIYGGVVGEGWLPGMKGTADFICLATVANILDPEDSAAVRCRHSTRVGNLFSAEGEFQVLDGDSEATPQTRQQAVDSLAQSGVFDEEEVDERCIV